MRAIVAVAVACLLTPMLHAQTCVPPSITTPPSAVYPILPGGSQPLSVVATGTNLQYRWWFVYPISLTEGTEATTQNVTVTPPYSRTYTITVSNECGSASANTLVCIRPRLLPLETIVSATTVTMHATVDPAVSSRDWPALQWYRGASGDTTQPLAGETGTLLEVPRTQSQEYWVRATNGCATWDSEAVAVAAPVAEPVPALSPSALVALALLLGMVAILRR